MGENGKQQQILCFSCPLPSNGFEEERFTIFASIRFGHHLRKDKLFFPDFDYFSLTIHLVPPKFETYCLIFLYSLIALIFSYL